MHYFKFDIEKWVQSTRHLLPEEEGVYIRLINHYYDIEKPLPIDNRMMLKRLQLLPFQVTVDEILSEYFDKTEKGWIHKKCDTLIKTYRKNRKINKDNGRKGGRPKKQKDFSESENKPDGLQNKTGQEPKAKAISNYKLRTKKDKNKGNGRFAPPPSDEVQTYIVERGITAFTGETFCDFYIARGWQLSHGKQMSDWKAGVRTWENRRKDGNVTEEYGKGAI